MYIMYIIYYIPTTPPPPKKNSRSYENYNGSNKKTYDIADETSLEIIQMRLDECQPWNGGRG